MSVGAQGDLNVLVRAFYLRRDASAVDLTAQTIPLEDVAQQPVRLGIDLGPCQRDPDRDPAGSECDTYLEIVLRRGDVVIDRQVLGPVRLKPGTTLASPPAVTLVEVASLAVTPTTLGLSPGQVQALQWQGRDTQDRSLARAPRWSSSNASVATVSADGVVTGVAAGTTTITATAGVRTATVAVTVSAQPPGQVTGRVFNALTNLAVAGATVTYTNGPFSRSAVTAGDGTFTIPDLPPADYVVRIEAAGFVTVSFPSTRVAGPVTPLEPVPLVPPSATPGAISGRVTNALTAIGIGNATVELREGMNATAGPAVATTTTASDGSFRFASVAAGIYSLRAVATDFIAGSRTAVSVGNGQERTGQNVVISPTQLTGFRIVLTWGATPSDLDSHLTGPGMAPDSARFHVYYANEGSLTGPPFAQLDIDQTSGFGPETITIAQQRTGVYRYSVHDYTNQSSTTSTALASSGARVQLYDGPTLVREFFVPNAPGTLWTVFELSGTSIVPVNSMTFQSSSSAVTYETDDAAGRHSDAAVIGRSLAAPKPR